MNKIWSVFFLLVFCLILPSVLVAQEEEEGGRLPAPADLPGLTTQTLDQREVSGTCPANILTLTLQYPQGLGLPDLDQALAGQAADQMKDELADLKDALCDGELCGGAACGEWFWKREFSVYAPSAGYRSLLFIESSYLGGAHGSLDYEARTYGPDGRLLTLTDVFPNPAQSAPRYWAYVYAQWCAAHNTRFPLHMEVGEASECRPGDLGSEKAPEVKELADLGRLVFTPEGATLVLGPYESGSYASGTMTLDLPKAELIKMGAAPRIWGQ